MPERRDFMTEKGRERETQGVTAAVCSTQAVAHARRHPACRRTGVRRGPFEDGASTIGGSGFDMDAHSERRHDGGGHAAKLQALQAAEPSGLLLRLQQARRLTQHKELQEL